MKREDQILKQDELGNCEFFNNFLHKNQCVGLCYLTSTSEIIIHNSRIEDLENYSYIFLRYKQNIKFFSL